MPKINYVDDEGVKRTVDADIRSTIMEAAVQNMIPGIDADCGGACACATCHVYVDKNWTDKLEPQDDMESSMLDFAEEVQENSRLSCQIIITEDLDGITVQTPKSQ
ncbi:MAG: 2Fe-2S iron-sulfur cluster binding domain-containing protein [Hyphomonadaceae bacterium]|nr:2Fe-2S iron-sulfur cluster binding domain-containing protein [Hyphomonadaceae bacterium]